MTPTRIAVLPVWDTYATAWEKVKGTKKSFWAGLIILFLTYIGFGILATIGAILHPSVGHLITAIGQVVGYFLQLGLLYMGILRANDLAISYRQMSRALQMPMVFKIIGTYLLKLLVYVPSFLLMIISAVLHPHALIQILLYVISVAAALYLWTRMLFAMAFVLDKEMQPWPAIVASFNTTKNNFWPIFSLVLLQIGTCILAILALFIGLFWVIPFCYILYGVMYKRLSMNAYL